MNAHSPWWAFQFPNIFNLKSPPYGLAFGGNSGNEFAFT